MTTTPIEHIELPEDDFGLDSITIHGEEVDKPLVASPYANPVEIIMDGFAWKLIHQHVREDLRYESGGVLLGKAYEYGDQQIAVRITMAVPAREAVKNIASITFTYESWRQMEEERLQNAPTEKLIGWYHTHPGFGSHFSSTDYFLHEHFFTQPWHIALLLDPVHNTHRFYRWKDGKLVTSEEYFLQITQDYKPEPPVNTMLAVAFEKNADTLKKRDEQEYQKLEQAFRQLASHLSSRRSYSNLEHLISLMIRCAELDPEAIAEARTLLQQSSSRNEAIRITELTHAIMIHHPNSSMRISHGWFLELINPGTLHIQTIHPDRQYFIDSCLFRHFRAENLALPAKYWDFSEDRYGNMFFLSRNQEKPIYLMYPATKEWDEYGASQTQLNLKFVPLSIEWREFSPAQDARKILIGFHCIYLLTRESIYVLHVAEEDTAWKLTCIAKHDASNCGLSSFTLSDWEVDLAGNLFILIGAKKEIWQLNQLKGETGTWQKIITSEEWKEPISMGIGVTSLYIYDHGAGYIAEYSLESKELLSKRELSDEVKRLKIHRIFNNREEILHVITKNSIYLLQ